MKIRLGIAISQYRKVSGHKISNIEFFFINNLLPRAFFSLLPPAVIIARTISFYLLLFHSSTNEYCILMKSTMISALMRTKVVVTVVVETISISCVDINLLIFNMKSAYLIIITNIENKHRKAS
jgi:hypothetical protein